MFDIKFVKRIIKFPLTFVKVKFHQNIELKVLLLSKIEFKIQIL